MLREGLADIISFGSGISGCGRSELKDIRVGFLGETNKPLKQCKTEGFPRKLIYNWWGLFIYRMHVSLAEFLGSNRAKARPPSGKVRFTSWPPSLPSAWQ